jgi:hypothetical protein
VALTTISTFELPRSLRKVAPTSGGLGGLRGVRAELFLGKEPYYSTTPLIVLARRGARAGLCLA